MVIQLCYMTIYFCTSSIMNIELCYITI